MKIFKKILLVLSCFLSLFLMVGCSTLTEEEREEQRKLKTEYEVIGKDYIEKSLKNKYGVNFDVYDIDVKQSKGSFFDTDSGYYIPSMTAKASFNNKIIDVFASIRENDSVCYDNYEREDILKDFNAFIYDLYKIKPDILWANIFVDIGNFTENNGMNKIKYSGNIRDYLKAKNKELEIVLIYNNIDCLNVVSDDIVFLFENTNKCFLLNSSSNFKEENIDKIILNNNINHFLPNIKEGLFLKDGKLTFIENNLKENKYFYYLGENENFNSLYLNSVDLHIDMWRDNIEYIDKFNRISEWFWAEPNSTYYLKSKYLKNYDVSKKYYVFSKIKDENNNYILKCEEITSTYFDYIVVENNNFGWFTICEYNN